MSSNKSYWIEVSIPADEAAFEAIENYLFETGSTGIAESEGRLTGYFDESQSIEDLQKALNQYIEKLRSLELDIGKPELKKIPSEDWSENWREYFKPIRITNRLVVKPPWESFSPEPGDIVLDIMPRMAFGTGTHETTQLCLKYLEEVLAPDSRILDIGTGSGILSIAAAKLHPVRITAFDVEEEAIENALENAALNGVSNAVQFFTGTLDQVQKAAYDLILANINRKVLEVIVPQLSGYLHPNGQVILSGILKIEEERMRELIRKTAFIIADQKARGEWIALHLKFKNEESFQ